MTTLPTWFVRVGGHGINLSHVAVWRFKDAGEHSTLTVIFAIPSSTENQITLHGDDALALMRYLRGVSGDAYAAKEREER